MNQTRKKYADIYNRKVVVEEKFLKNLPDWKAFDRTVELGYRKTKEVLASLPEETLGLFRD